jgi:hypothetical protein
MRGRGECQGFKVLEFPSRFCREGAASDLTCCKMQPSAREGRAGAKYIVAGPQSVGVPGVCCTNQKQEHEPVRDKHHVAKTIAPVSWWSKRYTSPHLVWPAQNTFPSSVPCETAVSGVRLCACQRAHWTGSYGGLPTVRTISYRCLSQQLHRPKPI